MQLNIEPSLLTGLEQIEIFLTGSKELPWTIADGAFTAHNYATGHQLIIRRKEQTELEFFNLRSVFSYELAVLINPKASSIERTYTYIRTGDYNRNCDKLLEELFRQAQLIAQTKLLSGDERIRQGS